MLSTSKVVQTTAHSSMQECICRSTYLPHNWGPLSLLKTSHLLLGRESDVQMLSRAQPAGGISVQPACKTNVNHNLSLGERAEVRVILITSGSFNNYFEIRNILFSCFVQQDIYYISIVCTRFFQK